MLRFTVMHPYSAGLKAGHAADVYDTALADDKAAAQAEFDRLIKEGRVAMVETAPKEYEKVEAMPEDGDLFFLIPMQGG